MKPFILNSYENLSNFWGAVHSIFIDERNKIEDIRKHSHEINPNFLKECKVSQDLQQIIKISTVSSQEALKKTWSYIKEHDLQDKEDRRQINIIGTKLEKLFPGKKSISMFALPKKVNRHLEPYPEAS